jgi:hypothetical protein
MADVEPGNNRSGGFRDLDDSSDIQSRVAPGTLLPGGHARIFSPQVNVGLNRVGADRAVGQSFGVILNECFHDACLTSFHRTQKPEQGLYQIRKYS